MAFPTEGLVANVTEHTIGTSTWTWNGYAWDRKVAAASSDSHGHTGDDVVDSFNGLTGDVTTNALILPVTGITSSGGATFDGDITFSGNHNILNSSGQTLFDIQSGLNIGIGDVNNDGNSTDLNIRDSHSEIIANAALRIKLDTPTVNILGGGVLGSKTDTDTYVNFADNNLTNFVAGGITYAQGTVNGLVAPVGLSAAGGATFTSNVTLVTDSGDIALTVKADTDNNNENDNPLIRLEQDGGAISTSIGMNGDDDAQFSGSLSNMFYIEADGSAGNHTHGIQFATANSARMTIDSDGNVGINEKFPAQRVDVDGIIQAQTGITVGAQGITFNDGTNMITAPTGVTQSIGFIIDGNGSPIVVGDKLDALKQVPINSYLLNTSAYVQDGVTATTNEISFSIQKVSALPKLTSAITGTTLDLGITGSVEQGGFTFMGGNGYSIFHHELNDVASASGSEISADSWLYPSVLGNSGDINKLQIFLTIVPN